MTTSEKDCCHFDVLPKIMTRAITMATGIFIVNRPLHHYLLVTSRHMLLEVVVYLHATKSPEGELYNSTFVDRDSLCYKKAHEATSDDLKLDTLELYSTFCFGEWLGHGTSKVSSWLLGLDWWAQTFFCWRILSTSFHRFQSQSCPRSWTLSCHLLFKTLSLLIQNAISQFAPACPQVLAAFFTI